MCCERPMGWRSSWHCLVIGQWVGVPLWHHVEKTNGLVFPFGSALKDHWADDIPFGIALRDH